VSLPQPQNRRCRQYRAQPFDSAQAGSAKTAQTGHPVRPWLRGLSPCEGHIFGRANYAEIAGSRSSFATSSVRRALAIFQQVRGIHPMPSLLCGLDFFLCLSNSITNVTGGRL